MSSDGFSLSPVIRARLKNWTSGTGGTTVLDLQVEMQQRLLDTVVKSIYTGKLQIDPKTAERLLLLADYLQVSPPA